MNPVIFRSSDTGAPTIGNNNGDLANALDKVLVKGLVTQAITSLTHSAGIITGTLAAHGYSVGDVISMSGAAQDEYNGRVTILTVPTSGTFTYAPVLSNPVVSPATGTLLGSTHGTVAGLGWQLVATSGNTRLYRPRFGTRMYLGVDDSVNVYEARVRGFEVASAAGVSVTGTTGAFPHQNHQTNGVFWQKTNNTAGNRAWFMIGDDRTFYYTIDADNGGTVGVYNGGMFGDFVSYKTNDAFNCMIIGKPTSITTSAGEVLGTGSVGFNATASVSGVANGTGGHFMARSYHQSGGGISCGKSTINFFQSTISGFGTPGSTCYWFPDKITNSMVLSRYHVWEPLPVGSVRGHMRGLFAFCHDWGSSPSLNSGQQYDVSDGVNKGVFEIRRHSNSVGAIAFEVDKEWR